MEMESRAELQLRGMGFSVQKLPVGSTKSPDFLVSSENDKYIIELKTKFSSEEVLRNRDEQLSRNGHSTDTTILKYENRLSGIIQHAADQLHSYGDASAQYRLVWLHSMGDKPTLHYDQFKLCLYGWSELFDVSNMDAKTKPCYYFLYNVFYPLRDKLDGAIISAPNKGLRLCLNNYSPRYHSFRLSDLAKVFGKAVCDPITEENNGSAYVADCNCSRKDLGAVLKYVQGKYGNDTLMYFSYRCHWQTCVSVPMTTSVWPVGSETAHEQ